MKISLGTVQFGADYGIANTKGKVGRDSVAAILSLAQTAGVTALDTAIAYGDAETTLGTEAVGEWQIVTKLPPLPKAVAAPADWVKTQISASLARLQVAHVDAVLLHRSQDLLETGGAELWRGLNDLKQAGLCNRIGVSIYGPEELDALPVHMLPDLLQSPFNPFDRRLETSGWAERLAAAGTGIHLRSTFLQGALLMPRHARDTRFPNHGRAFSAWDDFLEQTGQSGLSAALGLSLSRPWTERVVVGVLSAAQLQDILDTATCPGAIPPLSLACDDLTLIDPRQWKTT